MLAIANGRGDRVVEYARRQSVQYLKSMMERICGKVIRYNKA